MNTEGRRLSDLIEEYPAVLTPHTDDPEVIIQRLSKETGWSLARIVAELVEEEQDLILGPLDPQKLVYDWTFWGRPKQIPPKDDSWHQYAYVAGRGAGKTRTAAEWVHQYALDHPGCRIALVGRTAADARDVIVLGESGILNVGQPEDRAEYFSSKRRVVWKNGSSALLFSSEEPDQLRGPQFHAAVADEAAAWRHTEDDSGLNAWDNLVIATRLGENPQIMITTTPKKTPFMFDLIEKAKTDKGIILVQGSTMENAGNLSKVYIDNMLAKYEGTRLADQELYGLMLSDVEGAMWQDHHFSDHRVGRMPSDLLKVIAVDPSVAETKGDECGIIVMGSTKERKHHLRHAYILEDHTDQMTPAEWTQKIVDLHKIHRCPVVVEVNQGGALVKTAIHAIDPNIPILEVRATKGKALRAEPVTLKYDKGMVHHVGVLADLETQATSWVPAETKKSPDRVDALVWGLTALLIDPPSRLGGGKLKARSAAYRKLPPKGYGR